MVRKSIVILFILFVFVGCEKEDFTQPVNVDFSFGLTDTDISLKHLKSGRGLSMQQGFWFLESIDFEGSREQGGDYFFSYQPSTPQEIAFYQDEWMAQLSFDIPQGIYQRVKLTFHLIANVDHPAFRLNGQFDSQAFSAERFMFDYDVQETISLVAQNAQGGKEIVFQQGKPVEAKVSINTHRMFDLVPPGLLRNAIRSEYQGRSTIQVSRKMNPEIFQLMATRVLNSTEVVFE